MDATSCYVEINLSDDGISLNGEDLKEKSDCDSDPETVNKVDFITKEFVGYVEHILKSLNCLVEFGKELLEAFEEEETQNQFQKMFCDVKPLLSLYGKLYGEITIRKYRLSSFIADLFLEDEAKALLSIYKNYLNNYAANAKWLGEFSKDNQNFHDICYRVAEKISPRESINIDSCFYTIFNSLFSLSLLFNRYGKCFEKGHRSRIKGEEVETLLSDILCDININQKQVYITQKELSSLSGKGKEPKMNSRFVHKGLVTTLNRKEEKRTRQLVLFSDRLYITFLPRSIIDTSKIQHELSLTNMVVSPIVETSFLGTKSINGINVVTHEGIYNFYFEDEKTMKLWKRILQYTISEYTELDITSNAELGKRAPRWQKDNATVFCNGYNCTNRFTPTLRRHHCRADGLLYCDSCCSYKLKLTFLKEPESRVCQLCYRILFKDLNDPLSFSEANKQLNYVFHLKRKNGKKTGWLDERVLDGKNASFSSFVHYFCELDIHHPYLNVYERHEDKLKHHGIILIGMNIRIGHGSRYKKLNSNEFTVEHQDKDEAYLFKASSPAICAEWVNDLRESIINYCNWD